MGTLYIDTGGSATNSGSTDQNAANLSGSAASVAGSVVTLDGSPDLSGIVTSGDTQSSIYINDATNANTKIFWITAFDDTLNTVTVSVAPTGVTSSTWAIGGRHVLTNASIEGALRANDTVVFNNSPAAAAATRWTFRNAGSSTTGMPKIIGKTGTRPVLNTTNTSTVISMNTLANCYIENLELDQDGASGDVVTADGGYLGIVNVKISDGGGIGIALTANQPRIVACEITGVGSHGIQGGSGSATPTIIGNYIHDVTTDGYRNTVGTASSQSIFLFNIVDTCGGRGIFFSGTFAATIFCGTTILNNTVYGCGDSGYEVTDVDASCWTFMNNIFQDNGNAAGEYNFEHPSVAEYLGIHMNNLFNKSSNNTTGITLNSTELTSDPLLTNPSGGDFTLSSSSPAKATAYPGAFLGGSTGYLDMGAVQRQEAGGGSGGSFTFS